MCRLYYQNKREMKTILVDDELWALNALEAELEKVVDIDVVGAFSDSEEARAFIEKNQVDFAMLDVQMPGINGLELGNLLRRVNPEAIIIYVSSYPEYFSEAYRNVRADYYMLKPYKHEDVEDALERARLLAKRQKKKVQIRTFGRFDVFIDEQPIRFKNAKAKELFALCVERKGGIVTMEEAIDKLWEDSLMTENVKARYRKAVAYLHALFLEYRIPNVFISGYGNCHLVKENVSCDYYEFLDAKEKPLFFGEFMHEYSWAENTAAQLEMQMQKQKFL